MAFSFADLGFWWLAAVAFVLELLHILLESHWPEIRGSRLGPRPSGAKYFMLTESVVLVVAVAAAIGTVARMFKLASRAKGEISAVILAALGLLGMFFFVWQR